MSKRLEDFINTNSTDFDDLEPGNDLWAKIEKGLEEKELKQPRREAKTYSLEFVMRVAATVIVVMAIGFVLYIKGIKHTEKVNLADISPEYAQQQAHYASLVQSKRIELKTISKSDPQLYKEFIGEIAKMDSTYKRLNVDLATSPNQERVLRAMIRNLQIQTEVLNQQLQVIEQFNQMKKEESHASTKNI